MAALVKLALILALPAIHAAKTCDPTAITPNTNYTVLANQNIYGVATALNRSACAIARVNRMADPLYLTAAEVLLIPANDCNPTDTSCFLTSGPNLRSCIFGGPHTYTTVLNDTARYAAENKYNITVAALRNGGPTAANLTDADAILPPGSVLKLPICANSKCVLKPHAFDYGVLKDLAEQFETTVGQIEAINTNYYHSDSPTGGPTLVLPIKCHCPTGNDCSTVVT